MKFIIFIKNLDYIKINAQKLDVGPMLHTCVGLPHVSLYVYD